MKETYKDDLMFGKLVIDDLPESNEQFREFRVYLCAPYDDTYQETCQLFNNVLIKLREFCMARYGVEFSFINLNWDVNLSDENDIDLNEKCLVEIEKCKNQSIGMTFLCLIGDKYGSKLIPKSFDPQTFEIIQKCLKEKNMNTELLESYYSLNINYTANIYELNQTKMLPKTRSELFDLITTGVELSVKNNNLNNEDILAELNQSTLEQQLTKGALKNESRREDKVFSFVRLAKESSVVAAHDPKPHTIEYIRDVAINYNIPAEQIYRIRVDPAVAAAYLSDLGAHYERLFKNLVDRCIQKHPLPIYDDLFRDVLNHVNYVRLIGNNENKSQTSKDILNKLVDYVLEENTTRPLILRGECGSGKTSHLASFYSNLHFQCNNNTNHAVVIRFIGIDQSSTHLRPLLRSICGQISYIRAARLNNCTTTNEPVPKKLSELKTYFKNALTTDNNGVKLIIILDALNDLESNDYAYKLDWLPSRLHPSCKLIMSVSSESSVCERLMTRKYRTETTCYVHLGGLTSEQQAEHVIACVFDAHKCSVPSGQMDAIKQWVSRKRVRSLHLKILLDCLLEWRVFVPKETRRNLRTSLTSAIQEWITSLEKRFGALIVKHVLSYITISHCGLSENELQDMLSLDDELLKHYLSNDLIKLHPGYLKFPWYFILPILSSIANYLLVTSFHGIRTFCWKNKIFSQVVFKRYLDANPQFLEYLHKNISDYYLGRWANGTPKPLTYKRQVVAQPNGELDKLVMDKPITKTYHLNCVRSVPAQPIVYDEFHTQIKPRFNRRKLVQLPYHLIKAGYDGELIKSVYFNVDWIHSKIIAFDFYHLIYDFDMYKDNNVEVNLLCECLKSTENALIEDPKLLFTLISAHLLPFYNVYANIKNLIDQCDEKAATLNPLIPISRMFNTPGWLYSKYIDLQMSSVHLQIDVLDGGGAHNGKLMVVKEACSNVAKVYDLDQFEWTSELECEKGNNVYCNTSGDYMCSIDAESNSSWSFLIKSIETGDLVDKVTLERSSKIGSVCMSSSYACVLLRHKKSPLVIDLRSRSLVASLSYYSSFVWLSPDESVLLVHSDDTLFYHSLPEFKLIMAVKEATEIPEKIVVFNRNTDLVVLFKDTKQVSHYKLERERKQYTKTFLVQDPTIVDLIVSASSSHRNETVLLLVCALRSIYVFNRNHDTNFSFRNKIEASTLDKHLVSSEETLLLGDELCNFTGYGITPNNDIIYATIFTYLACFDALTGHVVRLFPSSSIDANRILKSYSLSNTLVSLLDNGTVLVWNLTWFTQLDRLADSSSRFDDNMRIFSEPLANIELPERSRSSLALTYSKSMPYLNIHSIKENLRVKSLLKLDLEMCINQVRLDRIGRYCYLECDSDNFAGKLDIYENDFTKKQCLIFDLEAKNHQRTDLLTFIVRKNSSFRIKPAFVLHNSQTYLLLRIVSSLADFDAYSAPKNSEWSTYENLIKLYGPIEDNASLMVKEFRLVDGEALESDLCVTKSNVFASLIHNTLLGETNSNTAKQYSINLNLIEMFEKKPVQLLDVNNILEGSKLQFLDLREFDHYLFMIYTEKIDLDYDYSMFRFRRDLNGIKKGAFIYDPIKNVVLKRFENIFKDSNVETMLVSRLYALDNHFNVFDLRTGKSSSLTDSNIEFGLSKFVFDGKYLISCVDYKLVILRTNDLVVVATFPIDDRVSLIRSGEADRTVLVGTQSGALLGFEFVVGLEHKYAIEKFIRYYRIGEQDIEASLKRIELSAHGYGRQLRGEVMNSSYILISSSSSCGRYSSSSSLFQNEINRRIHVGVARTNLTNVTVGIKYASVAKSRACLIQ